MAGVELCGNGEVDLQELGQEVGVGVEEVGGQGGGVEGGVGGLEFVAAGQFEGAVEGPQPAAGVLEGGGADAADFAPGGGRLRRP